MAKEKRGFAAMPKDKVRKIAQEGGSSQGKETNPGNFANRPQEEVEEAARRGGEHSHGGGR